MIVGLVVSTVVTVKLQLTAFAEELRARLRISDSIGVFDGKLSIQKTLHAVELFGKVI